MNLCQLKGEGSSTIRSSSPVNPQGGSTEVSGDYFEDTEMILKDNL